MKCELYIALQIFASVQRTDLLKIHVQKSCSYLRSFSLDEFLFVARIAILRVNFIEPKLGKLI